MDINEKLGAISAEFWSTIASRTAEKAPLFVDNISTKNAQEAEQKQQPQKAQSVSPSQQKHESQNETALSIKPPSQTLGDMIDETLLEGKKHQQSNTSSRQRKKIEQERNDSEEKAGSGRKKSNSNSKKWSTQERQTLLDLLACFGTDFSTIQLYFQRKTISQIKNKFHKEEKQNPEMIRELLSNKNEHAKKQLMLNIDSQEVRQHFEHKYNQNSQIGQHSFRQKPQVESQQQPQNTQEEQTAETNSIIKMVSEDIQRRLKDEGLSAISSGLPG